MTTTVQEVEAVVVAAKRQNQVEAAVIRFRAAVAQTVMPRDEGGLMFDTFEGAVDGARFEVKVSRVRPALSRLRAVGDKVIVRQEVETVSAGGVILPGDGKRKFRGEVLAVGPGKADRRDGRYHSTGVRVGDRVTYMPYQGVKITVDGEELDVVAASDVLAVIEP